MPQIVVLFDVTQKFTTISEEAVASHLQGRRRGQHFSAKGL